jgi:hypothetical protein
LIAATGDDVAFGSKGDISAELTHVRFTPESGHRSARSRCPLCADFVAKGS